MTDLHTHILPGIDDGSPDVRTSIALLQAEYEQGVDCVALTPHYYPESERVADFLARRQTAFEKLTQQIDALPEQTKENLPQLVWGAEVAWTLGMSEWEELPELCYEGSKMILLELPFHRWDAQLFRELNELMNRRALTPVIAHIDRYFGFQNNKNIQQLFEMGLPIQISAASLSVPVLKRRAWKTLKEGRADLLISDCHDLRMRKPNLGRAYELIEKKLGGEFAASLKDSSDFLLSDREE